MWIFLRDGFSSVRAVNNHAVMLRFRRMDHCDRFAARLGVDATEIAESDDTDYRYRFVVSRTRLAGLLAEEAQQIDYSNFKDACGCGDYRELLSDVWGEHRHFQETEGFDASSA
jgi:hypothetical protein